MYESTETKSDRVAGEFARFREKSDIEEKQWMIQTHTGSQCVRGWAEMP